MTKVKSSHMRAVGHDPVARTMHIDFHNGDRYEYAGVPEAFHRTMMGAKSIGEFFHKNVKPFFKGRKI